MMETSPAGRPDMLPAGSGTKWIKSTKCESAHCVQVAFPEADTVLLGSTQLDVILHFDKSEWAAFVAGAEDGEFDLDT